MKRLATYVPGILALLALLFFLQACEDSRKKGDFFIKVDGDINQVIRGNAVFGGAVDPDSRRQAFALVFTDGTPTKRLVGESVFLAIMQSGRPDVGTYDIVHPEDSQRVATDFWGYAQLERLQAVNFVSQDGDITIETSTEDEVSGSFRIIARGYDISQHPAELVGIRIFGQFTAEGGNAYIPDL